MNFLILKQHQITGYLLKFTKNYQLFIKLYTKRPNNCQTTRYLSNFTENTSYLSNVTQNYPITIKLCAKILVVFN